MSRLPDQFGDLLRLEAASGHATAEAGRATTTGSRMAMARLGRLYRYALRHPAAGRDEVIRQVARQTLRHGASHVLGRRTREARLFVSWGHQVHREVFAARTGLRFQPGGSRFPSLTWSCETCIGGCAITPWLLKTGPAGTCMTDAASGWNQGVRAACRDQRDGSASVRRRSSQWRRRRSLGRLHLR